MTLLTSNFPNELHLLRFLFFSQSGTVYLSTLLWSLHRPDGTIIKLVGTSNFKAIFVLKKGQMYTLVKKNSSEGYFQKYSRLRCLLRVKGLVIGFYLGWSGIILQFRQTIIKVGSKSWLLTCSSIITLSLYLYLLALLWRES